MLSKVAPTIRSISASLSWVAVGFTMKLPFILATLTSDIGPLNGTSESDSAVEAARPASASGIMSISAEIRLIVTKVSA